MGWKDDINPYENWFVSRYGPVGEGEYLICDGEQERTAFSRGEIANCGRSPRIARRISRLPQLEGICQEVSFIVQYLDMMQGDNGIVRGELERLKEAIDHLGKMDDEK